MPRENLRIDNEVVLCGYNLFNCYGMLRSLGEAGIYPTLIINNCDTPILNKSRYAKKRIYYFDKPEDVPSIIEKNIQTKKNKPIVICCEDAIQSEVDKYYDRFSGKYILSNCRQKAGEISCMMDKNVQMEIASSCGLRIPKTWKIAKNGTIPSEVCFPCIAKPEFSIAGSKEEIRVCSNINELRDILKERDYLVQEYIVKDFEAIIWGTSIENGLYYMPGVCKKIRQFPDAQGVTSYGVLQSFAEHPGIEEYRLQRFMRSFEYRGMFSIEFAVKDGKYYLLELNLRNDGLQYFSTVAGANLPLIYIKSVLDMPFSEPMVKTPTYFMGEITDIQQVLKNKVSPVNWLKDLFRNDCFFILNWKDPKPFLYQFLGKISSHIH